MPPHKNRNYTKVMKYRKTDTAVLDRETQCVQLRREGMTLEEIAKKVGYSNASGVQAALYRAYQRVAVEDIDQIRRMENERLDALHNAHWSNAMQGDVPSGVMILKVMDRRAKLLGLDMPVRIQQEVTVWNGDGNLDREIQSLIGRLAAVDGSQGDLADESSQTGAVSP